MRFTQLFALLCCMATLFSLGDAQKSKTNSYAKAPHGDVNGKFLIAALFLEEVAFKLEFFALILSGPLINGDVGKTFASELAPDSDVAKKLAEASTNAAEATNLLNAASLLEVAVGIPDANEASYTHGHVKPHCYAAVIREIKLKAAKLLYAIRGLLAARSLGSIDPVLLVEISIQIEELVIKLKQLAIGTYVCCDTENSKKPTYGRDYDSDYDYDSDTRYGSGSRYGSDSRYASDSRHGSDRSGYGSSYGSDSRHGSDRSSYGSDSRHGSGYRRS